MPYLIRSAPSVVFVATLWMSCKSSESPPASSPPAVPSSAAGSATETKSPTSPEPTILKTANALASVPHEAQIQRELAVQAAQARNWERALVAADQAVALAPAWSEAYFVRAGIRTRATDATLPTLDPRILQEIDGQWFSAKDVRRREMLTNAAVDLERYLDLAPGAEDQQVVVKAIAALRIRAEAIKGRAISDAERKRQECFATPACKADLAAKATAAGAKASACQDKCLKQHCVEDSKAWHCDVDYSPCLQRGGCDF